MRRVANPPKREGLKPGGTRHDGTRHEETTHEETTHDGTGVALTLQSAASVV